MDIALNILATVLLLMFHHWAAWKFDGDARWGLWLMVVVILGGIWV